VVSENLLAVVDGRRLKLAGCGQLGECESGFGRGWIEFCEEIDEVKLPWVGVALWSDFGAQRDDVNCGAFAQPTRCARQRVREDSDRNADATNEDGMPLNLSDC